MKTRLRKGASAVAALVLLLVGTLAGGVLLGPAAQAQDTPAGDAREQTPASIATDRPGFGNGSATMQPGFVQVELGYQYDRSPSEQRTHSLGQLLVRYGLLDRLELRLALNSFQIQDGPVIDRRQGFNDVGVGAKVNLVEGVNAPLRTPRITAEVSTSIPAGSPFGSDTAQPDLRLEVDWPLTAGLGLSANVGYTAPGTSLDAGDLVLIGGLGASVPGTQGLGAYAGYVAFPSVATGAAEQYVQAGATYLLGLDTQVDLHGGLRVDAGGGFAGLGLAHRF
jgi:hypothetical protein